MGFDFKEFMNEESIKHGIRDNGVIQKISVYKLHPAPDEQNFYHADDSDVRKLAASIELTGVQQNLIVKPVENGEYEIVAGHTRWSAVHMLLKEGRITDDLVPCKVENSNDETLNELILIFTNCTQRERTDAEKMQEVKRLKHLLQEYRKSHKFSGNMQKIIADILGVSKTKVGTLENIDNNLINQFKNEYKVEKISTNTANKLAGLPAEIQKKAFEQYETEGSLKAKDVDLIQNAGVLNNLDQRSGNIPEVDYTANLDDPSQERLPQGKEVHRTVSNEDANENPEETILHITTWYVKEYGHTLTMELKGIIEDEYKDGTFAILEKINAKITEISREYRNYLSSKI